MAKQRKRSTGHSRDYCSDCVGELKYNYAEKENGDLGLHSVECPNCGEKFKVEDDQDMWGMVEKDIPS